MIRHTDASRGVFPPPESDDPARSISTEPIVNFALRWLVDITFVMFVLAIVYMSFVPFDFTTSRPDKGWRTGRVILGLTTSPFNLPDILANIAYYMPIATLGFFVLRRRMGWLATIAAILILGSALSFCVEYGQQWTRSRVPSWSDVVANVLGLVVGLATAVIIQPFVRLLLRSAQDAIRTDLPGSLAKLLVCFLLIVHVRPFDIVADVPHRVLDVVRHGDFRPTARWQSLADPRLPGPHANSGTSPVLKIRARYEYALDLLAVTAGYAALSCLIFLSNRGVSAGLNFLAMIWCGFVTVSVAAIVTSVRVLMVSHSLDTAHALCGLMGWPIGLMIAGLLPLGLSQEAVRKSDGKSPALQSPRLFVAALTRWAPLFSVLGAIWVTIHELVPFDFCAPSSFALPWTSRIILLPMSGHLAGSVGNLVADVSAKFLRYSALASCLVWLVAGPSRMGWRARALLVTAGTVTVIAVLQAIHLFQPSRHCDATNVLISAVAAAVTVVMMRGIRDFYRAPARVIDDLLTRRLIEGRSFDRRRISSPRKSRSDASPMASGQVDSRD